MDALKPSCHVTGDAEHGEVFFAISGLWVLDDMKGFLEQLNAAAVPIVEAGKPIHVMGDMEGFVAQTRETGDAISDHLVWSKRYNLTRVAILNASSLVKMQYRRLSEGLDVDFFEERLDALHWLRRPYDKTGS